MTDMPVEFQPVDDEEMLTTGEAAEAIGMGTTARQVAHMLDNGTLPFTRLGRRGWARIPKSAVLNLRRQMLEALHNSGSGSTSPDQPSGDRV